MEGAVEWIFDVGDIANDIDFLSVVIELGLPARELVGVLSFVLSVTGCSSLSRDSRAPAICTNCQHVLSDTNKIQKKSMVVECCSRRRLSHGFEIQIHKVITNNREKNS